MNLIPGFIQSMLPFILSALPFASIWRALAVRRGRAKGREPGARHEIGVVLFALFMVGLLSQAIIPKLEWSGGTLRVAGGLFAGTMSHLNLVPGNVFVDTSRAVFVEHEHSALWVNFIGNIVMFMPIGFCLPLLRASFEPWKRTLFAGFCVSLFIELSQLPFARTTDVDDLWLNTLGVWLGWLTWRALRKKFAKEITQWQGTGEEVQNR